MIGADGPFRGKLLTDGLELYDLVAEQLGIPHFGCAQHARTYFHKAVKVTELPSGRALARVAMEDYLGKVFKIERQIKELRVNRESAGSILTPEEVVQWKRERSAPILTAFKKWLDDLLPGTAPQSALGKALAYTVRQWPKLVLHLEHGEVPIHNNAVENEIRPFSQGRRVWLFANNPLGARASANLFSLVSSARANGLEPYTYLNYVFENLRLRIPWKRLRRYHPGTREPPCSPRNAPADRPFRRSSTTCPTTIPGTLCRVPLRWLADTAQLGGVLTSLQLRSDYRP